MFAAGADIKEMADMSYADMVERSGPLQSSLHRRRARSRSRLLPRSPGYALGGGCELALCADYRIAADDAKLGQPEILLGVIPGAGGTQRLSRLVGPSKAKDMIFTGRFVDADEALQIGLVDKVVPAAEVYAAAVAWAAAVLPRARRTRCGPPRRRSTAVSMSTCTPGWRSSGSSSPALFATEDRGIGMKSFVENGPGKAEFEGL